MVTRSWWAFAVWLGGWVGLGFVRYGLKTMLGALLTVHGNPAGNPMKYEDAKPKR